MGSDGLVYQEKGVHILWHGPFKQIKDIIILRGRLKITWNKKEITELNRYWVENEEWESSLYTVWSV